MLLLVCTEKERGGKLIYWFNSYNTEIIKVQGEKVVQKVFDIYSQSGSYGLTPREGQENMSLDIAEAFQNQTNLLIEAGVGIGKSFGYLIPALLINRYSQKPIIIATSSIQLSEQIYNDAKFISEKLGFNYMQIVLGMGMNNYACKLKSFKLIEENRDVDTPDYFIAEGVAKGEIQLRSDTQESIEDNSWSKVSVSHCRYERCEYRHSCNFYKMRMQIKYHHTSVIIVNQDLFVRDIIKRNQTGDGLITNIKALTIIDEAHNFEEKVRSALTESFTIKSINLTIDRMISLFDHKSESNDHIQKFEIIKRRFYYMFQEIDRLIIKLIENGSSDSERFPIHTVHSDFSREIILLGDLQATLSLFDEDKKGREIDEAVQTLDKFLTLFSTLNGDVEENLVWVKKDNHNNHCIEFCPKNIDEVLFNNLFKLKGSVILTSATLCQSGNDIEDKYSYIKKSLGFEGVLGDPQTSPYDYVNNSIMYVANDLPIYRAGDDGNRLEYLDEVLKRIIDLCDITNGRTMVLFSAKEDLQYLVGKLGLIQTRWEKVIQKSGSNQDSVIQRFRESKGVLFGTGIFWEGINIQGPDLIQVIIVKLPFPVPTDPVMEYKMNNCNDSFKEVLIPEMLIKLRQGTGRLIRSETDKGIISILDSRLCEVANREYRLDVLKALPFKTVTENLGVVKEFAESKLNSTFSEVS
ncbi:ATP-dependent DNA helicase [Paenibacillus antibioticophila]|uniref:ATP-dependent DNA helicase n=1 Tax=Paenibacillus antibioticophila TaxID=1274374 RepID=UPI0013050BF6|nr:ATP-dependent DNA helicase [Paenibacillus antibioticophila]